MRNDCRHATDGCIYHQENDILHVARRRVFSSDLSWSPGIHSPRPPQPASPLQPHSHDHRQKLTLDVPLDPSCGLDKPERAASVLVLGKPGSGKTTVLRDICRKISQEQVGPKTSVGENAIGDSLPLLHTCWDAIPLVELMVSDIMRLLCFFRLI